MINVSYTRTQACPIGRMQVEKIVDQAAKYEKKIRGEVEVNIVSDKKIREINRVYRGKDAVTDVLSFAWQENLEKADNLGQIFISLDQIKRQAKQYKITVKEEFARMLIHGLLHLVGYDHIKEIDKDKMFCLQEKIVSKI